MLYFGCLRAICQGTVASCNQPFQYTFCTHHLQHHVHIAQSGLITIAGLERGFEFVYLMEDEMPSTRSIHGCQSTPRLAVVTNSTEKSSYCEFPFEILRSHDIKGTVSLLAPHCSLFTVTSDISISDQRPDHLYRIERMPVHVHNGDEVDPGLERQQEELETQRDIYRGNNIDHRTTEGILLPREECVARWEDQHGENDNKSSGDDEEDTGDRDHTTINVSEEDVIVEMMELNDEDDLSAAGEPEPITPANPDDAAVLDAKLSEELMYVLPTGIVLDFEGPLDLGWQTEDFEDDPGDARHVFEHPNGLIDGVYSTLQVWKGRQILYMPIISFTATSPNQFMSPRRIKLTKPYCS